MAAVGLGVVDVRHHADDRREFWGDIFGLPNGDINIVRPKKGVFIGWHCHHRQHDRIFLISGVLRIRLLRKNTGDGGFEFILSDSEDGTRLSLPIAWDTWHGYEAMSDDTCILQFNGPGKWDGTDEERMDPVQMPWPT